MKILYQRYYGLIARCNNCGCLIGYEPNDVSNSQNISCPQCKFTLWVPLNPNYDGIIKEESEEQNNGKSVVSEQSGTGTSNNGSK